MLPNFVLKLARALSTASKHIHELRKVISFAAIDFANGKTFSTNLHLLNRGASGGSAGNGFDKSSKLIMYKEISSTSERIGAITSEHRNVVPARIQKQKKTGKLNELMNGVWPVHGRLMPLFA